MFTLFRPTFFVQDKFNFNFLKGKIKDEKINFNFLRGKIKEEKI